MELNNDLPKIKSQLEELEKRLNAINKSKATNELVEEISGNLTNINKNLSNAESAIDTLQTAFGELEQDVMDNTSNIFSNTTKANNNQSAIQTLQTSLSSIQTDLDEVSTSLTQLEDSLATVATSGDYNDLNNLPSNLCYTIDKSYYGMNFRPFNIQYTQNHYFYCEPDLPIYFEIEITTDTSDTSVNGEVPFELKINDVTSYTGTYHVEYNFYNRITTTFSFIYYPTQNKNKLHITMTYESDKAHYFEGMIIKMMGHNAFMLTRDCKWTINCYKDNYYINRWNPYDNTVMSFTKFVLSKDNTEMNSSTSASVSTNPNFTKRMMFLSDGTISETSSLMGLGSLQYAHKATLYSNAFLNFSYPAEDRGCSMSTFRPLNTFGDSNNYTIPGIITLRNKEPIFYCESNRPQYFKLNGNLLKAEWVDTVGVWQQDMTNEQYYPFRGCMMLKDDGYYYYFPAIQSEYCVKLGLGKNGHLIKRNGSENLYAYIGGFNRVTQFVLEKDSEGVYQITKQTTKYGISEYCETLDDIAITVTGENINFVNKMFD